MSTTPVLPDVQQASQTIIRDVHGQAFLYKLAQLGYEPSTEAEAIELINLGLKLASVPDAPAAGQKQANESRFAAASRALDAYLGLDTVKEAEDVAWRLAHDPNVYLSTLVLTAEQVKQQTAA